MLQVRLNASQQVGTAIKQAAVICHTVDCSAAACLSPDVLCSRYAMKLRLM